MQELLITIVKGLVENPDAVSVTVDDVPCKKTADDI